MASGRQIVRRRRDFEYSLQCLGGRKVSFLPRFGPFESVFDLRRKPGKPQDYLNYVRG